LFSGYSAAACLSELGYWRRCGYENDSACGRSPLAIIAGYLGLCSLVLIPAPLALVFGILAVIDIKKNPKKHGMGRAVFGIIMGTIFSVPLVIMITALILSRLEN
jgi:hypothetical protein